MALLRRVWIFAVLLVLCCSQEELHLGLVKFPYCFSERLPNGIRPDGIREGGIRPDGIRPDRIVPERDLFGDGTISEATAACKEDEGNWKYICRNDRSWLEYACVPRRQRTTWSSIFDLYQTVALGPIELLYALQHLDVILLQNQEIILSSPATVSLIADVLQYVANELPRIPSVIQLHKHQMEIFLKIVNPLSSDQAFSAWDLLNTKFVNQNASSALLSAIETISDVLKGPPLQIVTPLISLKKNTFKDSFKADFNMVSVVVSVPTSNDSIYTVTTIAFASLHNILPTRSIRSLNDSVDFINGHVVMVKVNGTINNVSLSFSVLDETLDNPQCVFWNFSLFRGLGGWDDKGCELQSYESGTVICTCNHLSSFSILMSPSIPEKIRNILDVITYIGVGISMGSLVICLIIEALVWKAITSTVISYARHVSIVNIAVSLLIADIWLIIGAAMSDTETPNSPFCIAVVFFIHFFYLALFFWMLFSGLLLYRTVTVISSMSKSTMLAISFSLGYGAPLIIAALTIAVTVPNEEYVRETGVCWLRWSDSKALLAFVIPALVIVLINMMILFVVLDKSLSRGVPISSNRNEPHVVVVIARCMAILTPLFGLTWGLGVGTMTSPENEGIHIAFVFFNSLQGFFILLFGTLADKQVRSAVAKRFKLPVFSNRSKSTDVDRPQQMQ